MGNKAKELAPITVSRLTSSGLHFRGWRRRAHPSGITHRRADLGLRATIGGKRRDMGLGGYPDVTLAGARKARSERALTDQKREGPHRGSKGSSKCPRASRAKACRLNKQLGRTSLRTRLAGATPSTRSNGETRQQAPPIPKIGGLMVRDVELAQILAVLEPIWTEKTETATRLRGRIEQVLDWATARGYRDGLNPARWRGHLDKLWRALPRLQTSNIMPLCPSLK